jgi:hypothetical protein
VTTVTGPRLCVVTAAPPALSPVVHELVAILNETDSKDTFLVTVLLLKKLGAESKPALPAVVRNAERLAIFKGAATAGDDVRTRRQRLAREVFEAMEEIVQQASARSDRALFAAPPVVAVPPAPRGAAVGR